jgi:hypothetical protein
MMPPEAVPSVPGVDPADPAILTVAPRVRRPDTRQFSTIEGTCRMAGVPVDQLRRLIAKEIVDNALDACDRAGADCSGCATIERAGDRYTVTDQGGGIAGDAAALADLFSTGRAMLSGKYWREPSRGALGNGLRVLCAAVALSDGSITVETHGRHTVLRPQRFGSTAIVETTASAVTTGTRITYTLAGVIPVDVDDLDVAQAAIDLARLAGPPYARRPSPHWLDLDHLAETFATIEPDSATVRQLVEQLDGCTARGIASELAAPFGKGRTCRSMSEADTAALLAAMQAVAREVKPRSLGLLGADAFGAEFDGYAVGEGILRVGAHAPFATIPVLIEAWANMTARKGDDLDFQVYCNRTPVVSDATAQASHGSIHLSGAGLYGAAFEAPGGEGTLVLSVTAPLIPQTSLAKAPHLGALGVEIAETLRRAYVRSRNRLPADPQQPKPPRHAPPPKPPRPPPYEPSGPLAVHLAEEAEAAGVKPADLLVLSPKSDPFNETKASRRDAEWFANQVARFKPSGEVHLRGMYYRILASGDVKLPDGSKFVGTFATARMIESAGKHARYLGLVAFNRIIDERAAPPEFYDVDGERANPETTQSRRLIVTGGAAAVVAVPALSALLPRLDATEVELPRQPFRICMVGEKTSLGDVLRPIAREVHAELLLETGEISESHAYGIAARADHDGRPLRILYFTDFDPGGWQMPVSLARKLQAHIVREFPNLDVRLIRVALTLDQVELHELPDSPIKKGEKRAKAWRAYWGREQVEIDALAVLQPDVLDRIARAAVAPYFDASLEQQFAEATALPDDLDAWLRRQPAYKATRSAIRSARAQADAAVKALSKAVADGTDAVRQAVAAAPDRPELPPVEIVPAVAPEPATDTVFDSRDKFAEATRKLQRIKHEYAAAGGDDDDPDASDDDAADDQEE